MNTVLTGQQSFQSDLQQIFDRLDKKEPLFSLRHLAWNRFLETTLPTKQEEAFRYLNLKKLYDRSIVFEEERVTKERVLPFIYPECLNSYLVFINGFYSPSCSNLSALHRIPVLPLQEAARTYGSFLNNQGIKLLKEESDPFLLLNGALYQSGVFIYLPPKLVIESPLQILHFFTKGENFITAMPRVVVCSGRESQLSLVHSVATENNRQFWLNNSLEFLLEEASHLSLTEVISDISEESWCLNGIQATLKKMSRFNSQSAISEGLIRSNYKILLTGEQGEALIHGMAWLTGNHENHTFVRMEHQAPHCHSSQIFKNVLNQFSRSSFEGKIVVKQAAQKTDAFQRNNNLLLSDRAHADSKPNLEIFADDVKASHGATVGQLNEEELFYLKSRGLTESQAQQLLIYGFSQDIIEKIPLDSIRKQLLQQLKM